MKQSELKQIEKTNDRVKEFEDYYDAERKTWYKFSEHEPCQDSMPFCLWVAVFVSIIILVTFLKSVI